MADLTRQDAMVKVENLYKHLERHQLIRFDYDSYNQSPYGATSLNERMDKFDGGVEKYGLRIAIIKLRNNLYKVDDAVGTAQKYFSILFPPKRYPELWV